MELSAFVLAGGKSSRMGCDKALLTFGGRTLLERAIAIAMDVTGDCRIVGSRKEYDVYGEVVEDVFAGQGPLAGIHAALQASETDLNLILAVDTPFVEGDFLRHVVRRAEDSDAMVTVPRTREGLHPLCGIYRREFSSVAEAALREGRNKIDALFAQLPALVIEPEEIERLGFSDAMFRNLNSPEDVAGL